MLKRAQVHFPDELWARLGFRQTAPHDRFDLVGNQGRELTLVAGGNGLERNQSGLSDLENVRVLQGDKKVGLQRLESGNVAS